MIVVTGATGQYGRLVVEGLLAQVPAAEVGVSVRDPEKAADLARRGVRVVRGDFSEPATLAEAFEGAEQVLLVSGTNLGEDGLREHANAIEAAKGAGAQRILYTSHQNASPAALFVPGKRHAATEELLKSSGVPFVSLRNGFYAESALYQLGGLNATGTIALPADGPVSWTARKDLAEVGVAALLDPGLFDGITPPLTGSATLRFDDVARMASELLSSSGPVRKVTREIITDDAFVQGTIAHGVPEPLAHMLVTLYTAARVGEFDVVDPTLERALGRRLTAFQDVLAAFLA